MKRGLTGVLLLLLSVNIIGADQQDWITQAGGAVTRDSQGRIVAVDLRSSWITDSDLQALATIPTLTRLDLSLTRITDHGLQQLKSAPNISDLNLRFAEQITDGGILALSSWRHLSRLDLRGTKVTDTALQHLARDTALEKLDIGYVQLTDVGLTQLAALKGLKELTLGGNKLTDTGLQALRQLPELVYLDLGGAQRTDSGLWFVTITESGAAALASLHGLRRLRMNGSSLSVRSLEVLRSLPKLEQLDLENCSQINDQAIPVFAAMRSLRTLDVAGAALTPAGLERLRRTMPDCRILTSPAAVKSQQSGSASSIRQPVR